MFNARILFFFFCSFLLSDRFLISLVSLVRLLLFFILLIIFRSVCIGPFVRPCMCVCVAIYLLLFINSYFSLYRTELVWIGSDRLVALPHYKFIVLQYLNSFDFYRFDVHTIHNSRTYNTTAISLLTRIPIQWKFIKAKQAGGLLENRKIKQQQKWKLKQKNWNKNTKSI